MTTFTCESGGQLYQTGTKVSYSTLRSGAGDNYLNTKASAAELTSASSKDTYAELRRGALVFDTSAIGSGTTITACTLYLYVSATQSGVGTPSYNVTNFSPANPDSLVAGDYDSFSSTKLCSTDVPYSSCTPATWISFTFDSARLNDGSISKTGHTCIMFRDTWDINNSFTGTWAKSVTTEVSVYGYGQGSYSAYLDVSYQTVTPHQITPSLKYCIQTTPPKITKSLSYNIGHGSQLPLCYSIRAPHLITKSLKYVRVPITWIGKFLSYKITRITKLPLSLQYDIRPLRDTKTKQLKYTIQCNPIKRSLKYVVVKALGKIVKDVSYTIYVPHYKLCDKILKYDILPPNRKIRYLKYTIRAPVQTTLSLKYYISRTLPKIQEELKYVLVHGIQKSLRYSIIGTHNMSFLEIVQFKTVGTTSYTAPTGVGLSKVLVVGGGGGGGYTYGGGGGAGGFIEQWVTLTPNQLYTVTVGASGNYDSVGGNSVFGTLTAYGGGPGGQYTLPGNNGASGGGGGQTGAGITEPGISTHTDQGHDGGHGNVGDGWTGGGGGGAGEVGHDSSGSTAGQGGDGLSSDITGQTLWYSGGGAGGANYGRSGNTGGQGGGGNSGASGSPNTGGGGGGGYTSGGSGIVVVQSWKMPLKYHIVPAGTGTYRVTKSLNYAIRNNANFAPKVTKKLTYYVQKMISVTATIPETYIMPVLVQLSANYVGLEPVYTWNFGDGESLIAPSTVTHQYNTNGTYSATCSASSYYGGTAVSASTTFVLTASTKVIVEFYSDVRTGTFPLTVKFSNVSADLGGGAVTFHWDFGDGGESWERTPTYTYQTAGTYTVTLTAINRYGVSTSRTRNDHIYYDIESLNAEFSVVSGGTINDSDTSLYYVQLTVTDVSGQTDTVGHYVNVTNPKYITFKDLSTGNITDWKWDYGELIV